MVGSVSSDGTPIIVLTTSDIPFDAISGNYKLKECILNSTAAQESNPAFRPDQKPWEENLAENPHNRNSPHGLQGANRVGVPDGGMRAWLVVLGGFSNLFVLFGIMNSFGTFQTRYETLWRDRSTASITWIGSIQLFLLFIGGVLAGPAFDKYGARVLMKLGLIFCLASFVLSSWSSAYWHFLISQGFLFGIGIALLYYPTTGAISAWFHEKRGLALGLALSGSSVGGVFWPLLIDFLFETRSDEEIHRITTAIAVPLLIASVLLVREREGMGGHDNTGNETLTSQKSLRVAIFDWRFIALCISLSTLFCGFLIPFYYISLLALERGIGPTTSNNLMAFCYCGSFLGRIGTGWLADRLGRFNMLAIAGLLVGTITGCWIWMTTLNAMIVFAVLFGIFSGGLIPVGTACVAQTTLDMGYIGLRMGVMMAASSVGALGGGPMSGIIKDSSSSWAGVYAFSASVSLLGSMLLFGVRL